MPFAVRPAAGVHPRAVFFCKSFGGRDRWPVVTWYVSRRSPAGSRRRSRRRGRGLRSRPRRETASSVRRSRRHGPGRGNFAGFGAALPRELQGEDLFLFFGLSSSYPFFTFDSPHSKCRLDGEPDAPAGYFAGGQASKGCGETAGSRHPNDPLAISAPRTRARIAPTPWT